ncbi:MAG: S8 family peptidase [Bacteroidota bacterium]
MRRTFYYASAASALLLLVAFAATAQSSTIGGIRKSLYDYPGYPSIGALREEAHQKQRHFRQQQAASPKKPTSRKSASRKDASRRNASRTSVQSRFTLDDGTVYPDSLYEACCQEYIDAGRDCPSESGNLSCIYDYPPFCQWQEWYPDLERELQLGNIDLNYFSQNFLYYSKMMGYTYSCSPYVTDYQDVDWDFLYTEGYEQSNGEKIIALVDTGYDPNSPYLDREKVLWVNEDEIYGNLIDDDGNGYVDDRWGFDFLAHTADTSSIWNESNSGHGTYMSILMASAVTEGASGPLLGRGGDPGARIMNLRGETAEAIRYAADNGASIINLSWGFSFMSIDTLTYNLNFIEDLFREEDRENVLGVFEALDYAWEKGCVILGGSGNWSPQSSSETAKNFLKQNQYHYPSGHPAVIAVSGLWKEVYSIDYGVTFPGKKSDLVFPHYIRGASGQTGTGGTSLATAFVSGMVSLMWSYLPELTHVEVKKRLLETAMDTLFNSQGKDSLYLWSEEVTEGWIDFGEDERTQSRYDNRILRHDPLGWDEWYGYGMPNYRRFIQNETSRELEVDPATGSVNGFALYLAHDTADFNDEQLAMYQAYQETVLSVEDPVVDEPSEENFMAYPNPVRDGVLYLRNRQKETAFKLLDLSGRIHLQGTIHGEQLPVGGLLPGLYVLVIGTNTQKISINKP